MTHPLNVEIARLRRDYDELKTENAYLKDIIKPDIPARFCELYGLTYSQAKLVAFLALGGVKSREQILEAVGAGDIGPRNVDAHIKRIRKLVKGAFEIRAYYGAGYALEGVSLATVRNALAGRVAA